MKKYLQKINIRNKNLVLVSLLAFLFSWGFAQEDQHLYAKVKRLDYKHQLREMLHCSRSTFTRYVKMHQPELTKMGVTPRTQKLPPNAVNYLCYVLDIDLPEKNHIKVKP